MSSSDVNNLSGNSGTWQGQAASSRLQQLQQQFAKPDTADQKKLQKAAQEFEGIFVQQLLEAMDKTVDRDNSVMGGGSAEEYWRSMMNEQVAKSISSRPGGSGFGLAETIYRQMADQSKLMNNERGQSGDSTDAIAPEQ
jgi:Rod binding domain-containing protein